MAPERWSVRAHGMCISSQVRVGGAAVDPAAAVDLWVDVADSLPEPSPEDRVILSYAYDDGRSVVAVRGPDGSVLIDFSERARFMLSPAVDRITMSVPDPADLGFATVLLEGWVMSMALMLRGVNVFHATAVQVGGCGVALLANSGMGKSTVAAMLCRDGASLISDDVLRIDRRSSGGFEVFPGAGAIRLRAAAAELAAAIAGAVARPTPDGRVSVAPSNRPADAVPLTAVLIPMPSREVSSPAVEWLPSPLAAVELNSYPRVYDWKIADPVRSHFAMAADIASSVPVGYLVVPWGPPWRAGLLDDVMGLLAERIG